MLNVSFSINYINVIFRGRLWNLSQYTHTEFVGDMSALVLGAPLWWDWTVAVNSEALRFSVWVVFTSWMNRQKHIHKLTQQAHRYFDSKSASLNTQTHRVNICVSLDAVCWGSLTVTLQTLSGFRMLDKPQMGFSGLLFSSQEQTTV